MIRFLTLMYLLTTFLSSANAITVKEYPTSLPLFVGQSVRGPLHQMVRIGSLHDFKNMYGESNPKTHLQAQVELFFANGGQSTYIYKSANLVSLDQNLNSKYVDQLINALTSAEMSQKFDIISFTDIYYLKLNNYIQFLNQSLRKIDEAHLISILDFSKDISNANLAKSTIVQNNFIYTNLTLIFSQNENYGAVGAVLGALMQNDNLYGLHRALRPRLLSLGNIKPARIFTSSEIKELQDLNISAVINNGQNSSINHLWTTNDGPEFTQQNAARIGYMVYKNIKFHIKMNYANSPNSPATWNQISNDINVYYLNLYQRQILLGATSKQAFFVRVDETTTSPADIQNHQMNVLYGLNILGSDYIIYKYSQTMSQ